MKTAIPPKGYPSFLAQLKARIADARIAAVRSVSQELILLYWDIGQGIVEKQRTGGWGDAVVEMLARDLQHEFPDMRGFSSRNLWYMKRCFETYSAPEFLQQAVAETGNPGSPPKLQQPVAQRAIARRSGPGLESARRLVAAVPWGHHVVILDKTDSPPARLYYLRATANFGWSRSVLLNQIKAKAYQRSLTEKKTHNFALALPEHFAEQADEVLKSRYSLEFLGIGRAVKERELEDRIISRLQHFILELGYGFCFVGRQHRLALGRKEYFVDLLFYHRFLKALVAFDLKVGAFEPEHAGKMDFYLNLLNHKERAEGDQPSIGIILCAEKEDIEVEFSLKTKNNPIGVAEYELQSRLPARFKGRLPTARQLSDAIRKALPPEN